jgi:hypothetical protein
MGQRKEIKFITLLIFCINLYNVYEECFKIVDAQKANEHMPIRIQEKNY